MLIGGVKRGSRGCVKGCVKHTWKKDTVCVGERM